MNAPHWDDAIVDAIGNGVDGLTGRHALPPIPASVLCKIARGHPLSADELDEMRSRLHKAKPRRGPADHINANDLAQAGWGVVFARDDPNARATRDALADLLDWRQKEANGVYREFIGDDGIHPGESGSKFLARHGTGPSPVDPKRGVPYYLLIVGSPNHVPFAAQTDFSRRHAVGRLDFGNADSFTQYARAVVDREKAATPMAPRVSIFATQNAGDVNTHRSARLLASPLGAALETQLRGWQIDRHIADAATKPVLSTLLNDGTPPSILFTASHGLRMSPADVEGQRAVQGALVTQEWPGPLDEDRPLPDGERFAASDLSEAARLNGMIACLFACYSAGTPAFDEFLPAELGPQTIAPEPFVSRLPQRMLLSGAAAVIGHVERAWTWSFRWPGAGASSAVFESVMHALARGKRVGPATEYLHLRRAEVSDELVEAIKLNDQNVQNDEEIAGLWTAQVDARNYVVLGDPAVRLTVAKPA